MLDLSTIRPLSAERSDDVKAAGDDHDLVVFDLEQRPLRCGLNLNGFGAPAMSSNELGHLTGGHGPRSSCSGSDHLIRGRETIEKTLDILVPVESEDHQPFSSRPATLEHPGEGGAALRRMSAIEQHYGIGGEDLTASRPLRLTQTGTNRILSDIETSVLGESLG